MQMMMYFLVSQHVSGTIMPIIRRMVQNRQRLWCTALVVLQKTRGEEVVGVHLLGMVSRAAPSTLNTVCTSALRTTARQQLGCRKPPAVKKYGLSLLKMGKKFPETC
jgi:hypothetical protein